MKPHQRHLVFLPSFSYPTTKGFWVEFWVGMKVGHTCITYFAKSKTGPQGDASHTLWLRRASVWNFYNFLFLNIFGTPLDHESLFFWMNAFYLKVWATFISFFLFLFFSSCSLACIFFSLMPFGMDIFLFLLFLFLHSPYYSFGIWNFWERDTW